MKFELPPLPYAMNALEPFISSKTLEFHYGKHHQAYVDNLNKLIVGTPFENATLEEMIKKAEGPIFNNAAQVWNHTFYWNCFKLQGGGAPKAKLADIMEKQFGSFEEFKKQFSAKAIALFGSGWVWLVRKADGSLDIVSESNAGNPLRNDLIPILVIDVWEHAYYLDKQNKRAEYVEAFWNLIDWEIVANRL